MKNKGIKHVIILVIVSVFASIQLIQAQTTFFKTYGDRAEDHNDIGFSVLQTDDGGYVTSGVTGLYFDFGHPTIYHGDVYLVKTNNYGDTLWTKKYGKQNSSEIAHSMCSTNDGGFMLSAYGDEHLWLIRTDSTGDTLWNKRYPVGIGYSIQRTNDNGYVITGENPGIYLLKVNSEGDSLWLKTYGGVGGSSVQQTSDGGYIVVGFKSSTEGIFMIKTDLLGDTLWTKAYSADKAHESFSICETSDNGYFITGAYTSKDCDFCESELHIWLLKTDSNGDTTWTKKIDTGGYWNVASKGFQTRDGNYVIAGSDNYYIFLAELDTTGKINWLHKIKDEEYWFSNANDVKETLDGGYIMTGGAGSDLCLVKVNDKGELTSVENNNTEIPNEYSLMQNYPNPFNPTTTIKYSIGQAGNVTLKIYNTLGEEIKTQVNTYKQEGKYEVTFDGSGLPSGVYIYRINVTGNSGQVFTSAKKLVLLK